MQRIATTTDMEKSKNKNQDRRDFVVLSATAVACVGAAACAWPLIDSMNPAEDVLKQASVEVDISAIAVGQTLTLMWQGKPVFIRRRTPQEIQEAEAVNIAVLPDPQTDDERTKAGHREWLIVIGVCTHLGCVPIGKSGDYDGWFCPCHGSQYDSSGRIRKGPAPTNLTVPYYTFISDTKIKIGKEV